MTTAIRDKCPEINVKNRESHLDHERMEDAHIRRFFAQRMRDWIADEETRGISPLFIDLEIAAKLERDADALEAKCARPLDPRSPQSKEPRSLASRRAKEARRKARVRAAKLAAAMGCDEGISGGFSLQASEPIDNMTP
jgi:hypothetical protein